MDERLFDLLNGETEQVLLNGAEIRDHVMRTLASVTAALMTRSKNEEEMDIEAQTGILLASLILSDLGIYSKEVTEQIEVAIDGIEITQRDPHRINTGNKTIDDYVNMPFDMGMMEEA